MAMVHNGGLVINAIDCKINCKITSSCKTKMYDHTNSKYESQCLAIESVLTVKHKAHSPTGYRYTKSENQTSLNT